MDLTPLAEQTLRLNLPLPVQVFWPLSSHAKMRVKMAIPVSEDFSLKRI